MMNKAMQELSNDLRNVDNRIDHTTDDELLELLCLERKLINDNISLIIKSERYKEKIKHES